MLQFNLKRVDAMLVSVRNQLVPKVAIITNRFKIAAAP
jgi:3-methyladenine DNA glycosylase Tag